ncbi:MAG: heparinase II/III family protein [Mucilaginibacter polytrichastri]|nr:heparinase II/III family protein [Mucilaginibacter polytrichastri]
MPVLSRRLFLALLFSPVFFLTDTRAQIVPRNILQKQDTAALFKAVFTGKNQAPFPRTPEEWKALLPDLILKKSIADGESALNYTFPSLPAVLALDYTRNGNRTRYEQLSFEKRNALWNLVLAESMEGKGRFTDAIANGVWSLCEESYWGVTAHIGMQKAGSGLPDVNEPTVDLFSAETAAVLAWTDYFAGEKLDRVSPLIRKRIYSETRRRIFEPLRTARYGYLGNGDPAAKLNNWAPWVMSNYLNALYLLEKDSRKRVEGTRMALRYLDQYLNGLGDDGGCDEGPSYWAAAGACVFDALNIINAFGDDKMNVYTHPLIRNMGAYIYKTHIAGDYFINVADAAAQFLPDGYMVYRFGEAMNDPVMSAFGSWIVHHYPPAAKSYEQFHRIRTLFDFRAMQAAAKHPQKEPQIPSMWLGDVQLMAARSGNGFFVAAHAGNNGESHNHDDVGDFILYYRGEPVIIDAGAGTYTSKTFSKQRYSLWFNTSAYHNLPEINGEQQGHTQKFNARNVRFSNKGKQTVFSADIAPAYPKRAGIASWLRKVEMDHRVGATISDRFVLFSPAKILTQSLMTVCETDLTKAGIIVFTTASGQKVKMDYDSKLWTVKKALVPLTEPEDQKFKSTWGGRPITRIVLQSKTSAKNGAATYRFYL